MKMFYSIRMVVLLLVTANSHDHHECIHDSLKFESGIPATTTEINYVSSSISRSLEEISMNVGGERKHLRIHPVYQFQSTTDEKLAAQIQNELMPAAICMWENALRVNPVQGNLLFDRQCASFWQVEGEPCASFMAGKNMCGTEAELDEAWMNELTACAKYTTAGGSECATKPKGEGIANSDYVILVQAVDTETCRSSTQTLGYAHACRFDQYDRPIMGFINFCPGAMHGKSLGTASVTAAHELAHALGFSSYTWARMRKEDGRTPRTLRDKDGKPLIVPGITCANGQKMDDQRYPSGTLQSGSVRNNPNAFRLITPHVKATARQHYGCDTLAGAELENNPTGAGCWGSHWDQRVLHDELMAPIGGRTAVLSSFTLSAFADMGWYTVNMSLAKPLAWGKDMTCSFTTDKCINPTSGIAMGKDKGYFCTENTQTSCSVDRTQKARCNVVEYSAPITPQWFQYYPNNLNKGGQNQQLDFCPYFAPYSNQNCLNSSHIGKQNARGEQYGAESRCFDGSLLQDAYVAQPAVNQLCLRRKCAEDNSFVTIFAVTKAGVEMNVKCSKNDVGVKKTMGTTGNGFTGNIICPNVGDVCKPVVLNPVSCRIYDTTTSSGSSKKKGGSDDGTTMPASNVLSSSPSSTTDSKNDLSSSRSQHVSKSQVLWSVWLAIIMLLFF